MKLVFRKMHGIGNDYVYLDSARTELPKDPGRMARLLSLRRFSVGADGAVLILPSRVADARMRMFNSDGSEGNMCGNALRCVGKYLYDSGRVPRREITVQTNAGIRRVYVGERTGHTTVVTADMGRAQFPAEGEEWCRLGRGEEFSFRRVYVGNPHAVVFFSGTPLPSPAAYAAAIRKLGGEVNTEVVCFPSPGECTLRVMERGSGETAACGTGACAVVAAAVRRGVAKAELPVRVSMPGGAVTVRCDKDDRLWLTGDAVDVYEGVMEYDGDDLE